jgi:spore germination protein GerM
MKNNIPSVVVFIVVFVAVSVAVYLLASKYTNQTDPRDSSIEITSFEECVAAGYDVMESYPMQCATPSGQTFTQEIDPSKVNDNEPTSYRSITLFYYNPDEDTDETGNIKCSADGLVAVSRTIPISESPLQDAVRLLLTGNLTDEEIAAGITTEFPLSGLTLEGVTVDSDGVLVLQFNDPESTTVGGSCRTNILWQQIQATATQFDTVDEVRFAPEELFQP